MKGPYGVVEKRLPGNQEDWVQIPPLSETGIRNCEVPLDIRCNAVPSDLIGKDQKSKS